MKIIKRNGAEAQFDRTKIEAALASACADVPDDCLSRIELEQMAGRVEARCEALGRAVSVEEIQDMVVDELDISPMAAMPFTTTAIRGATPLPTTAPVIRRTTASQAGIRMFPTSPTMWTPTRCSFTRRSMFGNTSKTA